MKAKNYKAVRRACLKFIGLVACCITLCVIIYLSYNKMSRITTEAYKELSNTRGVE